TINLNKPGDLMISGTYVSTNFAEPILQRIWKELLETSEIRKRQKEVELFNSEHKYVKRGLGMVCLKNGTCFEEDFMNQASALVHVHRDGSVAISHSGIEMGQGLHTKMAMVAAEALEVDISYIRCIDTNTSRCPNSQPTAASSGQDINGPAVRNCCLEIKETLRELKAKNPGFDWPTLCNVAYFNRLKLTAQNFYTLPSLQWSWDSKTGYTGFYYGYGAAVTEAEINLVTGKYRLLRTDVLQDVGDPLNPTLDCGQVEGGFTQGMGFLTTEEVMFDEAGDATQQIEATPLSYAVPGFTEVPVDMRTSLLFDQPNNQSIHASKASAEAPTCLGISCYLAIKEAIACARVQNGLGDEWFQLPTPLSYEQVRLGCGDVSIE
ncbi:hypothetical protein KIPB_009929, partial [Kipferlia bialata]